jgi:hypothetical protein
MTGGLSVSLERGRAGLLDLRCQQSCLGRAGRCAGGQREVHPASGFAPAHLSGRERSRCELRRRSDAPGRSAVFQASLAACKSSTCSRPPPPIALGCSTNDRTVPPLPPAARRRLPGHTAGNPPAEATGPGPPSHDRGRGNALAHPRRRFPPAQHLPPSPTPPFGRICLYPDARYQAPRFLAPYTVKRPVPGG